MPDDDPVSGQMAGLSLYQGGQATPTSAQSIPLPASASPVSSPVAPAKPQVRLSNIPQDTSLREAFLVFSLCQDEVAFVDIDASSQDGPAIVAHFNSLKTARQVAQLLDGKALFGPTCPLVKALLLVGDTSVPSISSDVFQSSLLRSRMFFSDPFQDSPDANNTGSTSAGAPGSSSAATSNLPATPGSITSSASTPIPLPQKSSSISAAPPPLQATPQGSHSVGSSSSSSNSSQPVLNGTTASANGAANNAAASNGRRATATAQSVLDQLTSPILPSGGQNMLLLDDYNDLVRPWSSGSAPQQSKILPEPLSINTSPDWSDRRRFFAPQAPGSAGSALSPTLQHQNSNPSVATSPRFQQFAPRGSITSQQTQPSAQQQNQHQHQQQQTQQTQQQQHQQHQQNQQNTQAVQQAPQQSQQQHPQGPSQSPKGPQTPQQQPVSSQQQLGQPGQQHQQGQQSIPELSLLARIPPPTNPADQNPPCNTLYVGNLPPDATEMELRALFQPQKGFRRLSFKNKQSNGNSHHGPMCFVEFEDVAHAARALAELYGRTLPRATGSTKGGIRLSFSKNPLGVRGPGQGRRNSGNQYHSNGTNGNGVVVGNGNGNGNGNGSGSGNGPDGSNINKGMPSNNGYGGYGGNSYNYNYQVPMHQK